MPTLPAPVADPFDPLLEAIRPGLALLGFPAYVVDAQRRYRFLNEAYERYFGREAAGMLGRTVEEVFGPAPPDDRRSALDRALAGEALTFDREARHGPNRGRWIRLHYVPVRASAGVVAATVVLIDIQHLKDAQDASAARERQLSLITDTIGFPVTYIDTAGIVRFANTPGLDWLPGLTIENVVGKRIDEVYVPAVLETVRGWIDRVYAGEKVTYERQGAAPDGSRRWIRVRLIPDKVDGEVRGVVSVVIDIDDDRRLREALERQERELRFYAENIPEAIAFVGPDLRYQFVNKTFMRVRGQASADIIGRTVPEVLGEHTAAEVLTPFVDRLRRGETCAYERLAGPESGERRWYQVRLEPHIGEDGAFAGYYVVGTDIHDVKLAQERIAEQEAKLRLYTDNIPVSVAYLDTQRRYQFVNRTFAEMRGMAREDIIGRGPAEVLGEAAAADLEPMVRRVLAGEAAAYERRTTMPSGEQRWILGRSVPDVAADGKVRGMYVVGHDVQELKSAQEQLHAREEELRFFAEHIPEAIVYIDMAHGCTFVNKVFLETRGFTREELMGRFPRDVYPAEFMRDHQRYFDQVERGEEASYERLTRVAGTGEERWMRVRLTPRKDEAGRVLGYYVVSNDVHDLKAAQASLEAKEGELRQVIDSIPTPMVYVDAQHRYRYANNAFLDYAGRRSSEVLGHTVREVLGEERHELLQPVLKRVLAGEMVSQERQIDYADGRRRWMSLRYTPRLDAGGRVMGYYVTTSDIDEQKAAEEELRRAHSILSAHVEGTPLAVIEFDPSLRIVRWSGNATAYFGWSADEALGRALWDWRLVFEEDVPAVEAMFTRLMRGPESQATQLNRNFRKDGSVMWVEWHNSALRDADGRLVSILSFAQDVSSRIQAEERLQFMATHDGLTGLPNRLLLPERVAGALSRAQRHGHGVALLFLDLDDFKNVNDTLGHRIGDELLKGLARRLRATLRQSDLLVRLSGDEFVILLEDLEGEGGPDRVAQKILDDVMRPFSIEDHEVKVSASLGYAVFPDDGADPETLLRNADAAMYHAKELGRNSYRAFSPALAQRRDQRIGLEAALRRALRQHEFELYYQPILDVSTGHVAHVEALLRWHDPGRGVVLPPAFVPVAEETGLMRDIGHWVFEAAARQAAVWNATGAQRLTVSVNLSASQLRDSTIVSDFEAVLARTGCAPGWLTLEITETSMVKDIEGVSLTLRKLRRLGFRIAIDDFGTGFSSLSHLRHLPVDTLKIDKSFVADINGGSRRATESGGAAIVAAVTGLARGLGLEVVAEGVERQAQLDFLREQGCASFQGYLACRPVPVGELEQWLATRAAATPAKPGRKAPAPPSPRKRKPRTVKAPRK